MLYGPYRHKSLRDNGFRRADEGREKGRASAPCCQRDLLNGGDLASRLFRRKTLAGPHNTRRGVFRAFSHTRTENTRNSRLGLLMIIFFF